MPRVLMPGNRLHDCLIEERLGAGAYAISYRARRPDGTLVFLKQYKMPTIATPWYREYVKYQSELKRRIESTRARTFCYRMLEFFEEEAGTRCYFQLFEFVERGMNLREVVDALRGGAESVPWERRLVFAKVLMAGICALHESRIVHSDLKPENIHLFETPGIAVGFTLKLIDMDWSVLSDVKPPWHGSSDLGVVGTPGYMSPEHLRGDLPLPASDTFTCGLILYELLGGGHPYRAGDDREYSRLVLAHRATPPKLGGAIAAPASHEEVAHALRACLHPEPAKRPSATDVHRALTGTDKAPDATATLVLVGPAGVKLPFKVTTPFGRALATTGGGEEKLWSSPQFHLRRTDKGWEVEHAPAAVNDTLLNGRRLGTRALLKAGDVLAVGNAVKGSIFSPFKVELQ